MATFPTINYDPKSKTVTVTFQYDPEKHGQYPASKSGGKMLMVASTGGFAAIPGTAARFALNAGVDNPNAPGK